VPPDESYQLGSVGHQEGFIWECTPSTTPGGSLTGKERMHLTRNCGEMLGCGGWRLERGICGTPLPSEPPKSERSRMTYNHWH
jgi:hypothetical protein